MAKRRSIYVRVAAGNGPGGCWSLWWPAWKWEQLPADEQTAVIERQTKLMNGEPATLLPAELEDNYEHL